MEDPIKRQREIKEAPNTMIINGIEYQKVVPPMDKLTLTDIIRLWEFEFTLKWKEKENKNCDFYNQEIERLVQMIENWIPEYSPKNNSPKNEPIGDERLLYDGWDNYRRFLVSKFR